MIARRKRCATDHTALKILAAQRLVDVEFIGLQDDGYAILELFNCPACRTTLAITGIGPCLCDEAEQDIVAYSHK